MNVDFSKAIKMFFSNYANFRGRSTRAEYWWVQLFLLIVSFVLESAGMGGQIICILFYLAIIIPSLALMVRRLHDVGLSGYWLLGYYIVVIALATTFLVPIFRSDAFSEILTGGESISLYKNMYSHVITYSVIALIGLVVVSIIRLVIECSPSASNNQYGPDPYGKPE